MFFFFLLNRLQKTLQLHTLCGSSLPTPNFQQIYLTYNLPVPPLLPPYPNISFVIKLSDDCRQIN